MLREGVRSLQGAAAVVLAASAVVLGVLVPAVRADEPAARKPPVRVVAGGDIAITSDLGEAIVQRGHDPFAGLGGIFQRADIGFANLESVLAAAGRKRHAGVRRSPSLGGTPAAAAALARGGINVVSVANNHVFDVEADGLADSLDALRAANIDAVGAGLSAEQASRPLIRSVRGTTVGLIAFTSFVNHGPMGQAFVARTRDAVAATRALRGRVDLLLVSVHWGQEWLRDATGEQVALGHALVDAGADAVLGHHSHCIEPVELYKGRPILYSMGNFIWGRQVSPVDLTFLAELELSKDAPVVQRVRLHGLVLQPPLGVARMVSGKQARYVYGSLTGPSLRFRTRMVERDGALDVVLR